MATSATIKPSIDPYHFKDEARISIKRFGTELFRISYGGTNGDKERYEAFMKSLYPYDPNSSIELQTQFGNAISKTWTKEGDLLIHIEYIEIESNKALKQNDPDTKKW